MPRPSERSLANLKRGSADGWNFGQASKQAKAERERVNQLVLTEPQKVILELFEASARATTKLLKKWERSGAEPSRNLIDATKECRQLAVEAYDVYKATAGAAHAEQFFATMDARLESVASVLAEHSRGFEQAAS